MIGLELNENSVQNARDNVKFNNLDHKITIIQQPKDSNQIFDSLLKKQYLTSTSELAYFCMCNPPFYSDIVELKTLSLLGKRNRSGKRPQPKSCPTGSAHELVVNGGEVQFVGQIIEESCKLKERIRIYTTMLGHKSSFAKVLQKLHDKEITNICTTEFCQGHVTRWGVAWTFVDSILLNKVIACGSSTAISTNYNQSYNFILADACQSSLSDIRGKIESILGSINIAVDDSRSVRTDDLWTGRIVTFKNTWSKQRRLRRELDRKKAEQLERFSYESVQALNNLEVTDSDKQMTLLTANLSVLHNHKLERDRSILNLEYVSGSAGRDGAHQLLQFIKNKWK